jgi:hypothetical protein
MHGCPRVPPTAVLPDEFGETEEGGEVGSIEQKSTLALDLHEFRGGKGGQVMAEGGGGHAQGALDLPGRAPGFAPLDDVAENGETGRVAKGGKARSVKYEGVQGDLLL